MRLINQSLSDILRHGWQLTDGAKLPIILAGVIYLVVTTALQLPIEFMDADAEIETTNQLLWVGVGFILSLASTIIGLPMIAGWLMMGVKRVREQELRAGQVWDYMSKTGTVLLVFLLNMLIYAVIFGVLMGLGMLAGTEEVQMLMVTLGMLLAIGIVMYLAFCFSFALYLVADQDYGPLQALLRSREIVQQHFWKLALIQCIFGVLFILGLFTLGIAWIWVSPWFAITWGALYQDLFIVEDELKTTEIFDSSRYSQQF